MTTADGTTRHMPPARQALTMIAALRYQLPAGAALQLGLLPHVGRDNQGQMQTLVLLPGEDSERHLRQARGAQMRADAQVYVRPDPTQPHPWLFVDDLPQAAAAALARQKACLVVRTSPGNCQVRLLADRPLTAEERTACQRALVQRLGGDPGSVAGDKWGRLAGFTNRKPDKLGHWTELLADSSAAMTPAMTAVLLGVAIGAGPVSPPVGGPYSAPASGRPASARGGLGFAADPAARGWTDRHVASFTFACRSLARDRLSDDEIIQRMGGWLLRHGKRPTEAGALKLARAIFAAAQHAQPRGRG